jgi:hypothetical protein
MENNQKIVFKFSKINTRIKLIVLWVLLIISYNFNFAFDSFLELIRFSPIAKKIDHNIYLKEQKLLDQLIMDHYHGKGMSRDKLLKVDILKFLSLSQNTYFIAEMMIKLIPVLIIIANIFIKKNSINYINIIAGIIYATIGLLILFYYNSYYDYINCYILCIAGILILILIIIKSIIWLKVKEE